MTKTELIALGDIKVAPEQNFLILDDDSDMIDIICDSLDYIGFTGKLLKAQTIAQANKHIEEETIHYILSDWNLPDGDGLSFLKTIRNSEIHSNTPFIMISGQTDQDSSMLSLANGANGFLTKPFTIEIFVEKLSSGWKSKTT